MSNDINKVILTGNVGKKPVEKDAGANSSYVSFSLAVNESYKKGDNWVNNTHWVYCQCWFASVKKKALELSKGANICIEGSLNVYKPKDGNTIVSVKVSRIIAFRKEESTGEETQDEKPQEPQDEPYIPESGKSDYEEEMPF
jgi:single-strand DNA-binding protein